MRVEIPDLTGAECGDIAVTAAEGGINYWALIDEYIWERDDSRGVGWIDRETGENIDVPDDFVFFEITELEPSGALDPVPLSVNITPALLRRGFEAALSKARPDLVKRLLSLPREDWPGEIDADAADAIVQCGVFGEIVYG